MRKLVTTALTIMGIGWISCAFVPEALAFPHRLQIGDTRLYSETPIPEDAARDVLARSDRLLKASPISGPGYGRRIFLTKGGWRWMLLAPGSRQAIAITRPFAETIIFNRSDIASDRAMTAVGSRSLAGVIAHERTHGLIRAHFGPLADWRYPNWVREGYCDVVAGGGTLSDAQAAALRAAGKASTPLFYYDARKRVEAALKRNGGSVDRLFAEAAAF